MFQNMDDVAALGTFAQCLGNISDMNQLVGVLLEHNEQPVLQIICRSGC